MATLSAYLRAAARDGVPKRSLIVALVVGTVLNLINQGDRLLAGDPNVLKLALTYCVPYLVATYGAVSYRLRLERAAAAKSDPATGPKASA
jgi:hypothetical protein